MASILTNQVRSISEVTRAVMGSDLTEDHGRRAWGDTGLEGDGEWNDGVVAGVRRRGDKACEGGLYGG